MALFFWQFNDYDDIERQWTCFILNLIVFLFTLITLIRSIKSTAKITFQIIPLGFNLISTLVLLILKLFQKGYQFDLIGYSIQVFTYFLFGFTFGIVMLNMKHTHNTQKKMKAFKIVFILVTVILIALIILVSSKAIDKKCDNSMLLVSGITLACQIITYIPTIWAGNRILSYLGKKKSSTMTQTMLSNTILSTKATLSDQFTTQRRKQILLVLGIYTFSLILKIFLMIISYIETDTDLIQCEQYDSVYIITSDYIFGQIVLVLVQINQLLPHIIIPLALVVVTSRMKGKRNMLVMDNSGSQDLGNSITFNNDYDDQEEDRSQIIKSRVSSVFSDRVQSSRAGY